MDIVITRAGTSTEVTLEVDDPGACVGDLLAAVDPVAPAVTAGVLVEGRFHGPDLGLDEIGLCDEQEFEADVRHLPTSPRATSSGSVTHAVRAAQDCVEAMEAGFGGAMQRANESYRNLGLEAATVRDQLSEIDSSSGLSR